MAVEEYESDELAENSEDEKRLCNAEKRAMAKINAKKQSSKRTAQSTTKAGLFQQRQANVSASFHEYSYLRIISTQHSHFCSPFVTNVLTAS